MSEFKCPRCGQDEGFVAYELEIAGPILVSDEGYEPMYGKGLHYEIPDGALMACDGCGAKARALDYRNAAYEARRPGEEW